MGSPKPIQHKLRRLTNLLLALLFIGWLISYLVAPSYGAQLGKRSLELSDNQPSRTSDYVLTFDLATAGTLGSVRILFCTENPIIGDPCTAPSGFDASSAVLASQSGPGSFIISPASTASEIILTRLPANAAVGTASFHFTGIKNPSSIGSYYARLQTYATADASGPASDYGGVVLSITNLITLSAEVPPYLTFCTGVTINGLDCANARGDFIDFGELSHIHSSSGSSQMLVTTNAEDGYTVTVSGTTMSSGNNVIDAIPSGDVSRPGTAQFGFNLRANSTPPVGSDPVGPGNGQPQPNYNQPNSFRFVSGDVILAHNSPDLTRVYTASYMVNVPALQQPGVYVSTLTYICLADF